VEALGQPRLAVDPRFSRNSDRVVNVEQLRRVLSELVAREDATELVEKLQQRGVPAAPIQTVAEVIDSAQVAHQHMVVNIGQYRGIGVPIKLSRTPAVIRRAPAEPNADYKEILLEAGYSQQEVVQFGEDGMTERQEGPRNITS
jgi:crotonobetainyl-CoA:carnitine CoA-transferase CaiB-like acyl-CoA transferase